MTRVRHVVRIKVWKISYFCGLLYFWGFQVNSICLRYWVCKLVAWNMCLLYMCYMTLTLIFNNGDQVKVVPNTFTKINFARLIFIKFCSYVTVNNSLTIFCMSVDLRTKCSFDICHLALGVYCCSLKKKTMQHTRHLRFSTSCKKYK